MATKICKNVFQNCDPYRNGPQLHKRVLLCCGYVHGMQTDVTFCINATAVTHISYHFVFTTKTNVEGAEQLTNLFSNNEA